jgi:hypothetical protein
MNFVSQIMLAKHDIIFPSCYPLNGVIKSIEIDPRY